MKEKTTRFAYRLINREMENYIPQKSFIEAKFKIDCNATENKTDLDKKALKAIWDNKITIKLEINICQH